MGRELVVQLAAEGCSVAACDIDEASLAITAELAAKAVNGGGVRAARIAPGGDMRAAGAAPGGDVRAAGSRRGGGVRAAGAGPGGDARGAVAGPGGDARIVNTALGGDARAATNRPGGQARVASTTPGGDVRAVNAASGGEARAAETGPDGGVRAVTNVPGGEVRITTHLCDVSDEAQVARFRDEVIEQHGTNHINLLFNNAGVGGGSSFVTSPRAEWDRTFAICWGGVYNCSRTFMPLLIAADEACVINTSSVNGFWACGPNMPMSAYSAAKFAVKGFSESLVVDLRLNAPHVRVALVMPGHVGTEIVINSRRLHGGAEPDDMTPEELADARGLAAAVAGVPADELSDEAVRAAVKAMGEGFRDNAPLSAAEAATIILDGVRAGTWRILVGDDARALDEAMRADPLDLYEPGSRTLAEMFANMRPRGE
ncbi:hypothetical protein GCM10009850_077910 [Nonomuraea monospora]|uniref:Uncharacterized protein n=2 Tax=Nonomuraea monospora TaxID=568818 RepID=A0ABN3CSA5_9ACTN